MDDRTKQLLGLARWTVSLPLLLLFALSILFQCALVASLYLQQNWMFYAGVIGSWALIILFFIRCAMVYGLKMLDRNATLPKDERTMGYWQTCKIWLPFALHFSSFAILSTMVGLAYRA